MLSRRFLVRGLADIIRMVDKLVACRGDDAMTYEGTVTNGTIVLHGDVQLPEGTRVEVTPLQENPQAPLGQRLMWLAGSIPDMPADFAAQHDHYLHGTPRRPPERR